MFFRNFARKAYHFARSTSIFSRLLVSFLLVILVPGIFLMNYIYKTVETEFYNTAMNYVQHDLEVVVQKTYEKMLAYEKIVEEIGGQPQLAQLLEAGDIQMAEQLLYEKMRKSGIPNLYLISDGLYVRPKNDKGEYGGFELVNPEEFRQQAVYGALGKPQRINWFNTVSENNVYYGTADRRSNLGSYLSVTYRVEYAKGQTALLVATFDSQKLSGITKSKLYNQDLFLADANGVFTFLSTDFVYRDVPASVWQHLDNGENQIYSSTIEGNEILFATQKIGKGDWYAVSILPKAKVLQVCYDIKDIMVRVTVGTMLVSLLVSALVTGSISYPLTRLKNAMQRFAKEDFYLEYEDYGKDQIAQVSKMFKSMVQRINSLAERQVQSEKQISEEKIKQKEMYVSALQMQINPHFLYNMLDLIRWNIVHLEKGNGRVSRMISSYSNLLRYNIRLGEGYATLQEELDYVQKYIEFLALLYDKRIDLEIYESLEDLTRYKIGKLTFQPIIENTVIHGKLHTMENPLIRIHIHQEGETLCIDVLNNGKPMDEQVCRELNLALSQSQAISGSIGLRNVNQRIKLLFGEEHGLHISEKECMVAVSIVLPLVEGGHDGDVSAVNCR